MKKFPYYCLVALMSVSSFAWTSDLSAAIKAKNDKYIELFNEGKAEQLSQMFTEDALYLNDGFSIIKGRKEIAKQLKMEMSAGPATITLKTVELKSDNRTATEVGVWEVTIKGEKSNEKILGNYLVVWQKQSNGQWLIYRDVINYSEKHQTL